MKAFLVIFLYLVGEGGSPQIECDKFLVAHTDIMFASDVAHVYMVRGGRTLIQQPDVIMVSVVPHNEGSGLDQRIQEHRRRQLHGEAPIVLVHGYRTSEDQCSPVSPFGGISATQ